MEELSEILITIRKSHYLVQLEFPDGNPVQLLKEHLVSISEYFRTLCFNEIEYQYVEINEYTYSQACRLKHFLVCMCNGVKNIISELPIDSSLRLLEFDPLLHFHPEIIQSISANLVDSQYSEIKLSYSQYWNFRFINYSVLEKVAKREKDIRVILDWLNESSWSEKEFITSKEFKKCKLLIENHPDIFLPGDTYSLLEILSEFNFIYLLIDVKKLLKAIPQTKILSAKFK